MLNVLHDVRKNICHQENGLFAHADILLTVVQRIPISLLELNTFGHAFCALIIYILWWDKPFQVDYPCMIDRPRLEKRRALELMKNQSKVATTAIEKISERLNTNPRFRNLGKVKMSEFLLSLRVLILAAKDCDGWRDHFMESMLPSAVSELESC